MLRIAATSLVAVWSVLLIAWLTLHWGILNHIDEWRPQIEQRATRALGANVQIGHIAVRSGGWVPSFELRDVVLRDGAGREALRLPRVLAALSPRSLLALAPRLEQLLIDGAELEVRRDAEGRLYVGGIPVGAGPPGVFIMDCESFDILGKWEIERGPQKLHYDFWWNLPRDYMVSSEWGLPPQFENGIVPEDLLANKYGHAVHFWDLRARKHLQTLDLGANHQMALEIRPAHDPTREHGFLGVVVDTTNLEGSIWTWYRKRDGSFAIEKTATIPPEPADAAKLPPLLQGFGAVPPLITDIDLSLDDRFLYVACWGTGELKQYDVSDPMKPKQSGSVRIGGIVQRGAHPNGRPFKGGPQMTEISRDGQRVHFTNGLYSTWDAQFYPEGVPGVQVMCKVGANGGIELDREFYVDFGADHGAHQIRLEGGDCSTDSFCYPSA